VVDQQRRNLRVREQVPYGDQLRNRHGRILESPLQPDDVVPLP